MSYLTTKKVKGHSYWYEMESVWINGRSHTKNVRYIGKSLSTITGGAASKKDNILNTANSKTIPQKPGIYYLYNRRGSLIYIGAAERLRHRISAYHQENNHLEDWEQKLKRNAHYFRWRGAKSRDLAWQMEKEEIQKYNPRYNHYKKTNTIEG